MDILTLKSKVKLGCNLCDKCCIYRGDIRLLPINVWRISKYLNISVKEFIDKFTDRPIDNKLELSRSEGANSTEGRIQTNADGTTQKEMLDKFNRAREMYRDVHLCEVSLMPLALWLEFWLERQMKDSIRDSTYKSYCHMSKNYVAPFLGKKPLYKVTSIDLQALYAKLRESGRVNFHHEHGKKLSGSTVFSVHCMLHLAFDAAVKARFIPTNPTEGVVVPQKERPSMQVLNEVQLEKFMEAIREDKIWHDLFYTEIDLVSSISFRYHYFKIMDT